MPAVKKISKVKAITPISDDAVVSILDGICEHGRCSMTKGNFRCILPGNHAYYKGGTPCQYLTEEDRLEISPYAVQFAAPAKSKLLTDILFAFKITNNEWDHSLGLYLKMSAKKYEARHLDNVDAFRALYFLGYLDMAERSPQDSFPCIRYRLSTKGKEAVEELQTPKAAVKIAQAMDGCSKCAGKGAIKGKICSTCGGTGESLQGESSPEKTGGAKKTTVTQICQQCKGDGVDSRGKVCIKCEGEGEVNVDSFEAFKSNLKAITKFKQQQRGDCRKCHGSGVIGKGICSVCKGTGIC